MKALCMIAFLLLVIGGLNWGLMGLFCFNLVDFLVGGTMIDRAVYILIGVSAIYCFLCEVCWHKSCCR